MGILKLASLASITTLLIACYDPSSRDCTVTCSPQEPCADDQVCGSDGYCASPSVAGHCMDNSVAPDAAAAPVSLQIVVEGGGKVSVADIGSCEVDCMYAVPANVQLEVKAIAGGDLEFVGWTETCTGKEKSCWVTPTPPLTIVGARFE